MKRVLLLVCLIVSVVELDWERYRLYLLSSIASFLLVIWYETRRHKAQKATLAEGPAKREDISPVTGVVYPQHSCNQADHFARVESAHHIGEVALITVGGGTESEKFRDSAA